MKRRYSDLTLVVTYDDITGELVIDTPTDCITLDRDEATTLAEKLQDWLLHDE